MLLFLLLSHAVAGLAIVAIGGRWGLRGSVALGALPVVATLVWALLILPGVVRGTAHTERLVWISDLSLALDVRVDGFAALMLLVVSGIGVIIFAYAAAYLSPRDPGVPRLVGLLTLFAGSMVGLVTADNLLALYLFWELTSVTSYLLIGNAHTERRARAAALQAFLVTGLGGLAMFVGFVVIGQAAGTFRLSAILADPPSGDAVNVALVLVLVGAATKSAQYPFHSWLPGAMVAPTPVSAYLHSATMVKAGICLVARFAPAFAEHGLWRPIVVTVGLVTMLAGGLRALRQHDLKLLLAFGTVSQLGLLFLLFGVGFEEATAAGCVMLLAHALFKAALFMVVGIVDHQTGTRDLRALPGLGRPWLPTVVAGTIAAASMAGIPLTLGFVGKEAALAAFDGAPIASGALVLAVVTAASCVTFAYSARWAWGAFTDGGTDWDTSPPAAPVDRPPGPSLWIGPALLALLTLVLGVAPSLADDLVGAATASLVPGAHDVHLAIWHGFTLPLALSAAVIVLGSVMFVGRRAVAVVLATGRRIPSGSAAYLASLRGLNAGADRATASLQNGSLPFYAGVILLTVTLGPGIVLAATIGDVELPELLDSPVHVPIAILLVGAALGAVLVRRRLAAVVFLSVVGYAMAALFVIEGAPDLALTQVAIETLSTVVFVLVLRRLPRRFSEPSAGTLPRLAIAGFVGAVVFVFAIAAAGARTAEPVSDEMVDRAYPDGHGHNVVNVILVDFRGFDTLGEITVLAVASVGAVALARAGRARRSP